MEAYCIPDDKPISQGIYVSIKYFSLNELIFSIRGEINSLYSLTRTNIQIEYPGVPKAKIHSGLWKTFRATNGRISDMILKFLERRGVNSIIGTGHSIGGVYVILTLLEILKKRKSLYLYAVTFGQPHIGNKVLAEYLMALSRKLPIVRVTHTDAYEPRLPLSSLNNFYNHHPAEVWIGFNCDCHLQDVYWCFGREHQVKDSLFILEESMECNQKFAKSDSRANNGPYFDVMMGTCTTEQPIWLN
ncbi:hypothetical protein G9A89_021773 [Geosiphon pyriformis]|nr:hypothetical protein G9A89_021773 [Geosiphon pyriformis]